MDPPDDRALGQGDVPHLGRIAELEPGREEHRAHRAVGEDRRAAPRSASQRARCDGGRHGAGGRELAAFLVVTT